MSAAKDISKLIGNILQLGLTNAVNLKSSNGFLDNNLSIRNASDSGYVNLVAKGFKSPNYYYFTDFENTITGTIFSANTAGSGSNIANTTPATGSIGNFTLTTGTTATGRAAVSTGANTNYQLGFGTTVVEWRVRTPTALTDGTNTYTVKTGLAELATGAETRGVYFQYSISSSVWQVINRSASTNSTGTTSVTVVANTWYKLKIVVNAAATSVDFYIDDVLVSTLTGNIPTANPLMPMCGIFKSVGVNQSIMAVDYFGMNIYWTNPVRSV